MTSPASTETESSSSSRVFDTIVALLIAVVSVAGAIVAWRSAIVGNAAGDADAAGLRASINLAETRSRAALNTFDDYASYTDYLLQRELRDAAEEALIETDPEDDEALTRVAEELLEAEDATTLALAAFPNRYLGRDGSYNASLQFGEFLSDAARQYDLTPQNDYAEADQLRDQNSKILLALSGLAVALVILTVIESIESRLLRYLMLALGAALLVIGSLAAYLVEAGRL